MQATSELQGEVSILRSQQNMQQQVSRQLANVQSKLDSLSHVVQNMGPAGGGGGVAATGGTDNKSTLQVEREVKQLIASKQLNEAFALALNQCNLQGVLKVCQQVDPSAVFSPALPLHQQLSSSVCLSLIQQLAWEIASNTGVAALRLNWLQEALMALPTDDAILSGHIGAIMSEVVSNLDLLDAAMESSDISVRSAIRLCKHLARVAMK